MLFRSAAAKALAALARQPVPAEVCAAYGVGSLSFGMDYIIPKPLDPRVLAWEAAAVAQAAMDTGVATLKLDIEAYKKELAGRMTATKRRMQLLIDSFGYDF